MKILRHLRAMIFDTEYYFQMVLINELFEDVYIDPPVYTYVFKDGYTQIYIDEE